MESKLKALLGKTVKLDQHVGILALCEYDLMGNKAGLTPDFYLADPTYNDIVGDITFLPENIVSIVDNVITLDYTTMANDHGFSYPKRHLDAITKLNAGS